MPDKRMENNVPEPHADKIPSGTRQGTKMGTNNSLGGTEGTGLNPKADKIPSGERSGRRLGNNTIGPGVTDLKTGISHLKEHHKDGGIHKVGLHKVR